ncbi:MAG TPA: YccF family protein [Gemmataceae bacterium]|nr:YccF family protein [Gemmataceae bacterium]
MALLMSCPTCGVYLKAPDGLTCQTMQCPKCAGLVPVPAVAAASARPARASGVLARDEEPTVSSAEAYRDCPFCSEPIRQSARKCKHCGEMLDPALRASHERQRATEPVYRMSAMPPNSQPFIAGENPLSRSTNPTLAALANVLWIVFGGGLWMCWHYLLGGFVLCLTIVGIPFGLQCIKLGLLALLPFGKQVVDRPGASGCLSIGMNILWIPFGIWIVVSHALCAVFCAITIIMLPFAVQHLKLAGLALAPFGREIR